MKKKYIVPTVAVTKCQLEGLIAASPSKKAEQYTPAGDGGDIPQDSSGDGSKAKEHFNAWTAWED